MTDDPRAIAASYAELNDDSGGGWRLAGKLVTRQEAARSAMKRCQTCASDVPARMSTKRFKKVSGLGAGDLGRLLHGHPIESIRYEPGAVTVRTSQAVHRFDPTDSVQLDSAAGADPDL